MRIEKTSVNAAVSMLLVYLFGSTITQLCFKFSFTHIHYKLVKSLSIHLGCSIAN